MSSAGTERDQPARSRLNQQILDSAIDFAIIATGIDGQITSWNAGAAHILGWSEAEMLGGTIERIFTPEDRAGGRMQIEMDCALEAGRANDERWHLRKSGELFWANGEMTPMRDEAGHHAGFVKVLRDRTEQHAASEAHRSNAEFLRGVLGSSDDCIKVLDLEGKLTFMSDGGQRVMEVSDFNSIRGCPWPDFWVGAGNAMAVEALETAKAGGTGRFQGAADTLQGNPRWWDVRVTPILGKDGKPEKILSISRDITATKAADDLLLANEKRWREMFDKLVEGLIVGEIVRDETGAPTDWRYVDVNSAWAELVGIEPSDAKGRTVREVLPGIEDQWIEEMVQVVESGDAISFLREVGSIGRWYEGRAFPLEGDRFGVLFLEVTNRRKAEERLRLSEAEFRSLTQAMPNQAWTASADGALNWFNDGVYAFSGADRGSLDGQGWTSLVHPDDLERAAQIWGASLTSGATYETEFRIRAANGDYRWHLVRAVALRSDDGEILRWVGTNTDIDDQKRSQVASVEDRDRLWALSRDLMLVCDYNGVITAINPSAYRMLGWTEEEMLGHTLGEFIHPDDVASTGAEVAKLATGATTLAFENRYRSKDGSYRLLDWTAVPEGNRIHAVGRDVTAERRLAKDSERIWSLSPVVKVVATTAGDILAVNPSWSAVLGWTSQESVGQNIMTFVAPEDREVGAAGMEQLADGLAVSEFENVFVTKDGGRRRISWNTVPEGGTLYGFGRDITAEVEAAETLEKVQEALRQSQKMEAVGQLTGGIAHDFNNLLMGITGSLELMQARMAQGRMADVDRYITAAHGGARRAAALTHRLLAFSRRQTLDPKPVNINRLISDIEDMVRRTVGPQIEIEVVGAAGLWSTLVDANQLENAVLNLCINARDAMPDGGRITIETANKWLDDREAKQRGLRAGQYLSLCVTDTGTGMTAEVIERAFDPFYTTKPLGSGTGLGLSMIYGFVQQSGGQVRIYSELGMGTTMCLYFPRHHGEMDVDDAGGDVVAAVHAGQGQTVLVVDDEPTIRMLVADVLVEAGFVALEASDGQEALRFLQSKSRIDLLITDVGLPGGLNGRQLADAARVARPDLKVLFITGYAENAVVGNGHLEAGMAVLSKPFPMEALNGKIEALMKD